MYTMIGVLCSFIFILLVTYVDIIFYEPNINTLTELSKKSGIPNTIILLFGGSELILHVFLSESSHYYLVVYQFLGSLAILKFVMFK